MKLFHRTMMGLAGLVAGLAANAPAAAPLARGNQALVPGLKAAVVSETCPIQTTPLLATAVDGVPGNRTPDDLVRTIVGSGVTFSNIQFRGVLTSAGNFTNAGAVIGFSDGIVLSSGDISNVIGPNQDAGVTRQNGLAGDTDLDGLVAGFTTQDATVLEFDFIPNKDVISFQYVFASDEYNEFVNTSYNDVFGFFLNGTNVALLPSTLTGNYVVSINNVNGGNVINGSATTTNAMNPEFYRDNGDGHICTEMDGLTVVLNVLARVRPNAVNHIKLAIADAGDDRLDSNIFIKSGSFSANHPPVAACSPAATTNSDGSVTLGVTVTDTDGDALTVVWSVNALPVATNQVPGSVPTTSASLALTRMLPPGTNTVSVTVSDGKATAVCSTLVAGGPAGPIANGKKKDVLREMTALRASVKDKHDGDKLDKAIEELEDSLEPKLWVDETHLQNKEGEKVFHEEMESVYELMKLIKEKNSRIPDAILQSFIDRMVAVDRLLAEVAINEAAQAGRDPKKISEARKELVKAEMELTQGNSKQAIDHFGHAWKHAQDAKIGNGNELNSVTIAIELADGIAQLEIWGLPRQKYVIQTSTNLANWANLATLVADQDGAADYQSLQPPAGPMRFYRVIAP